MFGYSQSLVDRNSKETGGNMFSDRVGCRNEDEDESVGNSKIFI